MKNKKKLITTIMAVTGAIALGGGTWFGKTIIEQKAFQAGAASIITEVVGRTVNSCEPINLFVGEQKVDLVNVACLNQGEEQADTKNSAAQ